jgi:hypothetical protein
MIITGLLTPNWSIYGILRAGILPTGATLVDNRAPDEQMFG